MNKKYIIFLTFILFALSIYAGYNKDFLAWMNHLYTPDFNQITNTKERKAAFFNYLNPIVQNENNKIKMVRALIKNNNLDQSRTMQLAKKYRITNPTKEKLLEHIDIIPTSVVLAQAAIESNWGRSYFANRWHNYFGIWCFKKGCGVVPKKRDKSAIHEVAQFSSTTKAVEYYMLNINRNNAYKIFRQIRKHKRDNNLALTGKSLAEGLDNYAAIGYEYVELVQGVIRQNKLYKYD